MKKVGIISSNLALSWILVGSLPKEQFEVYYHILGGNFELKEAENIASKRDIEKRFIIQAGINKNDGYISYIASFSDSLAFNHLIHSKYHPRVFLSASTQTSLLLQRHGVSETIVHPKNLAGYLNSTELCLANL